MELESVERQETRRNTVAYPERNESDLEEIAEEMERVEDEQVAEAVEEIRDIVNSGSDQDVNEGNPEGLRGQVGGGRHFTAPIRSLNNPDANTVEFSDIGEAQIVGEEFGQINQNLPRFMDDSNLQWWVASEQGDYEEEEWNDGGEHIREGNLNRNILGYRIELDGQEYTGEEVVGLANRLRAKNANNLRQQNSVPQIMLNYDSLGDLNQDLEERGQGLDEEAFRDQYETAQEYGLVTEDGNLTLKGWLSAVDMEAGDLRGLEELSQGAEGLELQNGDIPMLTSGEVLGARGVLNVEVTHPVLGDITELEESGRVDISENGHSPVGEDSFSEIFSYLSSQGFNIDTDSQVDRRSWSEGRYTFDLGLKEALEYFEDIDLENDSHIVLGDAPEQIAGEMMGAAVDSEIQAVEVEAVSDEVSLTEDDYEELAAVSGVDSKNLEKKLRDNIEVSLTDEGVEIEYDGDNNFESEYDGDNNFESRIAEQLVETGEFGLEAFDSDGELDFGDYFRTSVPYITLLPFKDEINEHTERENRNDWNEFDNSTVGFSQGIEDYDDLSLEARREIERLEEQNILDIDFTEIESSNFEIKAQDPLEYREVISELEEILHTDSKSGSEPGVYLDRAEVEYDVRVETVNIEAGTEDFNRLEEALDTRLDGKPGTVKGVLNWLDIVDYEEVEETVKGYERSYNDGLKHKLNALIDESEGVAETLLQGTVIPEPEEHEVTRRDYDFENMGGQVDLRDEEDRLGYSNRNIEDFMEEEGNFVQLLEELEEAGILEIEFDYRTDSRRSYGNEVDQGTIESFYSLEEEQREKLESLRDRDLIDYEKPDRRAYLEEGDEFESFSIAPEANVKVDEVYLDETEAEVDVDYHNDGAIYEPTEEARTIAEALDPMNFDKTPYEDVEVETDFEFNAVSI
jgi:hypothetical protein